MTTETETEDAEAPQEEGPRSFSRAFELLADGKAQLEASAELVKVVDACRRDANARSGTSKGRLAITLMVTVQGGVATVNYDIKSTVPSKPRESSTLFITKGGNLTPDNPRQTTMGPRILDSNKSTREVDAPAEAKEI